MALFVLRKLVLQTRMCSHPVGLDVWCVRTAKALAILPETAQVRRLAWAFAGRICDKYHNLMSWLISSIDQCLSTINCHDESWNLRNLQIFMWHFNQSLVIKSSKRCIKILIWRYVINIPGPYHLIKCGVLLDICHRVLFRAFYHTGNSKHTG